MVDVDAVPRRGAISPGVWDGRAFWLHLDGRLVAVRRASAPAEIAAPPAWIVSSAGLAGIDEVRAWSTARATSQIARQMGSRVSAAEPGLVQSLRFAVASPTTARPVLEPAGGRHRRLPRRRLHRA